VTCEPARAGSFRFSSDVNTTRVLMQLLGDCELPEYVSGAAYFRFGYCTADVPVDRVEDLRRHPGVRALSHSTSRSVRDPGPHEAKAKRDWGPSRPRR